MQLGIGFFRGIPTDLEDWYLNEAISDVIVVDDQMAETATCSITKGPHRNLAAQNLFHQGKIGRTMSLNSPPSQLFNLTRGQNASHEFC